MADIDPRIAYIDARKACAEASEKLHKVQLLIDRVASDLGHHPQVFYFSGGAVTRGSEPEYRKPVADAANWPSADDIMTAIIRFEQTYDRQVKLWSAMDKADRNGLNGPEHWPTNLRPRR